MRSRPERDSLATRARRAGFTLIELLVVIGIIVLLASLVLAVSGSVIRASEERATRNTLTVLDAATEELERTLDRRIAYRSGQVAGGVPADPAGNNSNGLLYNFDTAPAAPPAGSGTTTWNALAQPYSSVAPGLPAYSTAPFRRTAHLVWELTQNAATAPIMQQIPESYLRGIRPVSSGNAQTTAVRHCVDSWDTPIVAVFPGRDARLVADPSGAADAPANIDADGTVRCDSEWGPHTTGGMRLSCRNKRILWVSAGNDARFINQSGAQYVPSSDNLYSYEP
jgi:prepilin-type N-terminal cleavage/methylation domain-containing protein